MYIYNKYNCSKTIYKGREGNEPGIQKDAYLRPGKEAGGWNKGESTWLEVDLCQGSSFIFWMVH